MFQFSGALPRMSGYLGRVKVGVACGVLAMVLYAGKSSAVDLERIEVLAVGRDLPLGTALSDAAITTDKVVAEVVGDYLLATDDNRALVRGRTAHLALHAGSRLVAAMFIGGLEDDLDALVPAGHRKQAVRVREFPAGLGPGDRVDLVSAKVLVASNVLVIALKPFTVAVPNTAVLDLSAKTDVTVAERGRSDAGEIVVPRTRAQKRSQNPAKDERTKLSRR